MAPFAATATRFGHWSVALSSSLGCDDADHVPVAVFLTLSSSSLLDIWNFLAMHHLL